MNISDKIIRAKEDYDAVYEAGQKSEYDRFWDTLQNNGEARDYSWFGTGITWTDDIYKPKYPFICTNSFNLFRNSRITDIKVPVDISRCTSGTHNFCFEVTNLVNVPKVIVSENTSLTYSIYACHALEEIRFEGTIGKSLDIHYSTKLSYDSVANIFGHLGGTASATLTLPASHNDGRYDSLIADIPSNWAVSWL